MKLRDEDCGALVGLRGSGKSHYAKHRIVNHTPRVVCWDPNGEYADPCDLDEVSLQELLAEPELLGGDECRVAVVPDWDRDADLAEAFEEFKACLKNAAPHAQTTVIVIDECGLLRPKADGALVALAAQSRHWRMPLVLIAQRAMMLPPGARAQCSFVVSFRQNDPDDIKALAERIGAKKAARVAELPRRRFVVWSEAESFRTVHSNESIEGTRGD